ncbi:hypothetical protein SISSUDRAFT_1121232 [Sistotremastrum suecicum HHB10207 ss-3]|uniref:Uncharacterized protein n=1 Tax=Sistotremastrum suecicum HHB10207 ss-3 TaxID=1314776 RepID=A0A166B4U8_9AGAM|nr:hypothetical protein SISSUDRAFT_1121232 [Sistotremastrum suecicum HHB10207 ss-3]
MNRHSFFLVHVLSFYRLLVYPCYVTRMEPAIQHGLYDDFRGEISAAAPFMLIASGAHLAKIDRRAWSPMLHKSGVVTWYISRHVLLDVRSPRSAHNPTDFDRSSNLYLIQSTESSVQVFLIVIDKSLGRFRCRRLSRWAWTSCVLYLRFQTVAESGVDVTEEKISWDATASVGGVGLS